MLADRRQHLHELAVQVGQLQGNAQQLKTEGQELRSKLNLVQSSHQGASCPLCGTELGLEGCQRLLDSYDTQIEQKLRLYQENQDVLDRAESEKLNLDKELTKRDGVLRRGREEAQTLVAVLERDLAQSQSAAEELGRDSRSCRRRGVGWKRGRTPWTNGKSLESLTSRLALWTTMRTPISVCMTRCRSYNPSRNATVVLRRRWPVCRASRSPWPGRKVCISAARRSLLKPKQSRVMSKSRSRTSLNGRGGWGGRGRLPKA